MDRKPPSSPPAAESETKMNGQESLVKGYLEVPGSAERSSVSNGNQCVDTR